MAVTDTDRTQLLDDGLQVGQGEEVVDDRAQLFQWCICQRLGTERGQQVLQVLQRVVAKVQLVQALVKGGELVTGQVPVGQAAVQGVGRLDLGAADAQVDAQFAGDT